MGVFGEEGAAQVTVADLLPSESTLKSRGAAGTSSVKIKYKK